MKSICIVGAGQAGAQVAISLRQKGYEGALTIIGDEGHLPYQRPPLSKRYLKGEMPQDGLYLRPAAFYEQQKIDVLNDRVTQVDMAGHQLTLASGETKGFDRLVFATGTRARQLPAELDARGKQLAGIFNVRSISDIDRLRPHMQAGKKLVIVGGGYVGLEVAAVAKQLGLDVVVLEAQERLLKRVVAPQISEFFAGLHAANGVKVLCGQVLKQFHGTESVSGVETQEGEVFPCDLVLSAVGALPNDSLALASNIECDDGILVDGQGRTSHEDIYACGDCSRFFSPRYNCSMRLESVQNAIDQAKIVAGSLMGEGAEYDPLPWFWSDQYDCKLQIAGLARAYERVVEVGSRDNHSFYIAYLQDDKLVCVDSVNHPKSHMMARRVIGQPWREDLLPPA
ncbi:NAD(P)/FAD-dependent oxidoreductase [Polycladidibacter stylochi]|uniref:NAD(P)/FAD-dependent oxidoreductase n=1 Tax=Polycladidibacter stylochi TaxID=1807766 RepID=UPI000832733D|nr:FAD-dependent oxidoreductase [Pseudovibrio stylochi]